MAYLKPPWFTARIFNRIAMATGISGTQTLTVRSRVTGDQQQIPIISVDVGPATYLVSTRGESDWVRNVRANPTVTLTTGNTSVPYQAAEIPVEQREPVLAAYRIKAGKIVDGYFAKLPDAADHPVFVLKPA